MVSADTGPMQIAAAVDTPVVGLFGPTSPARNGPWGPRDLTVSRFDVCQCHHQRQCRVATWCLGTVTPSEVCAGIDRVVGAVAPEG
jgi:heptosyltransferase-1